MLPSPHTLIGLIALAATLWILRIVAWRIVLAVDPASVRIRSADGTFRPPDWYEALGAGLKAEGFTPIGVRLEHPRFGKPVVNFDFAHPALRTFATIYGVRGQARAYLLSALEGGALVRTPIEAHGASSAPRPEAPPAAERASLAAALEAHRHRCEGREQAGAFDAEGRLRLARAWFEGPGAALVRRQQLAPVLWSLVTLGMVLWALLIHL